LAIASHCGDEKKMNKNGHFSSKMGEFENSEK